MGFHYPNLFGKKVSEGHERRFNAYLYPETENLEIYFFLFWPSKFAAKADNMAEGRKVTQRERDVSWIMLLLL